MKEYVVITYTTKYRLGGDRFARVAHTLETEKKAEGHNVYCQAIESKRALKSLWTSIKKQGNTISEFHFIGHSGMYGPMYGTIEYPEQFSPYEIKNLDIPFAQNAAAYFHCCRSARWFAPYFARTTGITTYGYHWYTSFSLKKDKYKPDFGNNPEKPLYCFGCPGKKSHGYLTSIKKYTGRIDPEKLKKFDPEQGEVDDTYNSVAQLYHNVFTDIKVRKDEYNWIRTHLPQSGDIKMLDIGCGNGALLRELSGNITMGTGVDISESLLALARKHNQQHNHITFQKLDGPELPFPDDTFNLVISMLSFRYLDWDPIMKEIQRVIQPNGKLLIVDMVTAPVRSSEWPKFIKSKLQQYIYKKQNPNFHSNLQKLVSHPNWKNMLTYNPIRSQHEMKWYLESRFPGRTVEIINIGYNSRIIAFDSGNMNHIKEINLTYP